MATAMALEKTPSILNLEVQMQAWQGQNCVTQSRLCAHADLSRSTFQSSKALLVKILYTTIGEYAPLPKQHSKLTPNPTLINPNPTYQIKALKHTYAT